MPIHDIIDNRNQKLVGQIKRILDSTEAAHFAVGYFFLSGFTTIAELLKALSQRFVPAGEEAQTLLSDDYNQAEEQDLLDALKQVSNKYDLSDFDAQRLQQHIEHDIKILKKILDLVEPITPDKDTKLQTLIKWLSKQNIRDKKRLIFTQYADTAKYLADNLNPDGQRDDIDVIYSGNSKNKARVVGRFAPKANKEYKFKPGESELNTLIATDVLAEGLNLQDGDLIINYDLHWNPVKLIQRFGRIDRIGSDKDVSPEVVLHSTKNRYRNNLVECNDFCLPELICGNPRLSKCIESR